MSLFIVDATIDNNFIYNMYKSSNSTERFELWMKTYVYYYPELLNKIRKDFNCKGLDWKIVGKDFFKDFPDVLLIEKTKFLLKSRLNKIIRRITQLELNFDINFILYIDIACGAGWATYFKMKPACLAGILSIIKFGWQHEHMIDLIICHEIGHLIHVMKKNGIQGLIFLDSCSVAEQYDPFYSLFSEGFAQRIAGLILGDNNIWVDGCNWFNYCKFNEQKLAKLYLDCIEKDSSVENFFLSLKSVYGKRMVGYYLGYRFIQYLENYHKLNDLPLLDINYLKEQTIIYLNKLSNKL